MTNKNNKRYPFVKFAGSLSLLFTMAGVLLAIGGQLNVLGATRQPIEAVKQSVKPAQIVPVIEEMEKPKYSFYDSLKQRKTELGMTGQQPAYMREAAKQTGKYVVQVGAFRRQKDANVVRKKVENLGYPARIVPTKNRFLTQAGPFEGINKARSAERRLRQQRLDTLVKKL